MGDFDRGRSGDVPRDAHDSLFKAVFSERENALALFRAALPPELLAEVEGASLRLEAGSFIAPSLRKRLADLLFSAKLRGRRIFVYFLLEHQAAVDPLMPVRVYRSIGGVWDAWLRSHEKARRVPAVIAIVVHQGPRRWTGPVRLSEAIALPKALAAFVSRHLPELELCLHELSGASMEKLASLAAPPVVRLTLMLMRSARGGHALVRVFDRWSSLVSELLGTPQGEEWWVMLLRYTVASGRVDMQRLEKVVTRRVGRKAGRLFKTTAEQLREEGREEGQRDLLARMLRARFRRLDERALARLARATAAELEVFAERLLVAPRLEDVFRPAPARRA